MNRGSAVTNERGLAGFLLGFFFFFLSLVFVTRYRHAARIARAAAVPLPPREQRRVFLKLYPFPTSNQLAQL